MTSAAQPRTETLAQRNFRLLIEAAEIIRGWPLVRERLQAAHVPDAEGRCHGCTSQTRTAPHWPCALAMLARGAGDPARLHTPSPHFTQRGPSVKSVVGV